MMKRKRILAASVPVLLLSAVIFVLFAASASQAAELEPIETDIDDHMVVFPLLFTSGDQALCYAPGTESDLSISLRTTFPAAPVSHSTTVTVTTTEDEINGDISSVAALLENPGTDGLALREAIAATNNDPGQYTILFSSSLAGKTINAGGHLEKDLPPIQSSGVTIDGDIDGDQVPDITLSNAGSSELSRGIRIQSGQSTLHALKLVGYTVGVEISAQAAINMYQGIAISNLVIEDSKAGIMLTAGAGRDSKDRDIRWADIYLIHNDLEVYQAGIEFLLTRTTGAQIDNVLVHNNTITIAEGFHDPGPAMKFAAGYWPWSTENQISNVMITNNTIRGNPDTAVGLAAGSDGANGNSIKGVVIGQNDIQFSDEDASFKKGRGGEIGIDLRAGNGSLGDRDFGSEPPSITEQNVISDVQVGDNTISGFRSRGIQVVGGVGRGASHNRIESIFILSNRIDSTVPGEDHPMAGIFVEAGSGGPEHKNNENSISRVIIQSNSIELNGVPALTKGNAWSGAISVIGGGLDSGADRNRVENLWITLNKVDSVAPGIQMVGGWMKAAENVISGVQINCNSIANNPADSYWGQPLRGIVLAGGVEESTSNRVENISLYHNNVAGVMNDVTAIANVTDTAVDNVVDYQAEGESYLP